MSTPEDIVRGILGALAPARPRLRVPGNLVGTLRETEKKTGVPFEIIAGAIQATQTTGLSGDWPVGITPDFVRGVGLEISQAEGSPRFQRGGQFFGWRLVVRDLYGEGRQSWLDRFDRIVYSRDKSDKPILGRPEWEERKETQIAPGTKVISVPKMGSVGGYKIRIAGDERDLSRTDYSSALRKGLISPDQYEAALRSIGYSDEQIYLIEGLDLATGPTAEEKRLAKPVTADDITDLYREYLGRRPENQQAISGRLGRSYGQVLAEISSSQEAAVFRVSGDKMARVRQWATALWRDYGLSDPTPEEVMNIVNLNLSEQETEDRLRARRYGTSDATLGEAADMRKAITNSYLKILGRRPTDGEVNFAVVNRVPTRDTDALAEQTRDGVVWAGNPEKYMDTRSQLQDVWTRIGLQGKVTTEYVNPVVTGEVSLADMAQRFGNIQAPGYKEGVPIKEVNRVRSIAKGFWDHFFPGEPVTSAHIETMLGMTNTGIRDYVGSLPWRGHQTQPVGGATPAPKQPEPAKPPPSAWAPDTSAPVTPPVQSPVVTKPKIAPAQQEIMDRSLSDPTGRL